MIINIKKQYDYCFRPLIRVIVVNIISYLYSLIRSDDTCFKCRLKWRREVFFLLYYFSFKRYGTRETQLSSKYPNCCNSSISFQKECVAFEVTVYVTPLIIKVHHNLYKIRHRGTMYNNLTIQLFIQAPFWVLATLAECSLIG